MVSYSEIPVVVVLSAVLISAATDMWKFKVYNVLTLPLLLSGLIYHAVAGGATAFAGSVLGMVLGFVALTPFYLMGGMGAGDVKLIAAIGAWLGLRLTFYVLIASCLASGVYALAVILVFGRMGETWLKFQIIWHRLCAVGRYLGTDDRVETHVSRADRRGHVIPFAAMVAIGVVAIFLWFRPGQVP